MSGNIASKLLALAALIATSSLPAFANDTVVAACKADEQSRWNCACVNDRFSKLTSGKTAAQKNVLADITASMFGDTEANQRMSQVSPMTMMGIVNEMGEVATLAEACVSTEFGNELAQAQEDAERLLLEQDAANAAEEARINAIPTAPPPPEVTSPPAILPPVGEAGVKAASSFREVIIAECRSFGNKIGYCACQADGTEKLMTRQAVRAYYVSAKMNTQSGTGEVWSESAETAYLASHGMTAKEHSAGIAKYNHVIQSREKEDLHHACEAYY